MPSGLPRPLFEGQPVPYTASVDVEDDLYMGFKPNLKHFDDTRMKWCWDAEACLVCGDGFDDEAAAAWDTESGTIVDGGLMHDRCGRIAMAHCPHLKHPHYQLVFGSVKALQAHEREDLYDTSLPEGWVVLVDNAARAA